MRLINCPAFFHIILLSPITTHIKINVKNNQINTRNLTMGRNILLHCHFFKNAGSSIDYALRRCFPQTLYENKTEFSIVDWNDFLASLLQAQPEIQAVSSHVFSLTPPKIEGIKFHCLTMFRHPIERVTSVAAYDKKRNFRNSTCNIIKNHKITLRGYIKSYLRDGTPASIRNVHTMRFAGEDRGTCPATQKDFNKAIAALNQCPTVGLVNNGAFDESMVLFEEHLKPAFPNIDLSYIKQNVHQRPQSINQRLRQLEEQIGEELFNILLYKNKKI